MYANLSVKTNSGERLSAYEVTVAADGTTTVQLDDPTDEGSYYVHVGTRVFAPGEDAPITIAADF